MLCGQDISLVIHDRRKSKLVVFKSSEEFNLQKIDKLQIALAHNDYYENLTNKDYEKLCDMKIVTSQPR